ncbi:MAG: hypothetical protein M3Q79_00885 [bacterium]|nr:hypothetical protein [bacterium]
MDQSVGLSDKDNKILAAIAEDLRAPLLKIAYTAELASYTKNIHSYEEIELTARSLLSEIDSLLLGIKQSYGQLDLHLSPMAPSAVLYEAIQRLKPIANARKFTLHSEIPKSHQLAMVHPTVLGHVISSLSRTLIEISSGHSKERYINYQLAAEKQAPTLSIVTTANAEPLIKEVFSKISKTNGNVSTLIVGSDFASGIYVVQQLLASMNAAIRPTKNFKGAGFKIIFTPSTQLSIV